MDTHVTPDELARFALTLRNATRESGKAAASIHPTINAGKSTQLIEESTATLLKALSGLVDGMEATAGAVEAGKTTYVDNEAAISADLNKITGDLSDMQGGQ